jgi:cell division protein FtsI (penicillin-binding protein 3)
MNRVEKNRIIFVFTCFCLFFLFVLGKAFKVQLIDASDLISRANSQFLRQATIYPKRGNIYDREGNALALNLQTYSIFTIPKAISDKSVYKKLSQIIPEISYRETISLVNKRKRFTWVGRKLRLSKDQVEQVKELKGIFIEGVPERTYPNHELLSQTLGFVGLDNSGLAGLEHLYDKELKGKPVTLKYTIDNKGRPIKFESHQDMTAQAKDIYLTIDKDIQGMAEKYLKEAVLNHSADKGGVGVIDASTGEILAIANYPAFDPNEVKSSNPENRKLAFATDPFEPGSAFKLFTVASAFEHKVAKIDSSYYCEQGHLRVDGHIISEAESHERYEWLSVADIVKFSSNIGTTKIAFDLTFPKFKETLKILNFGEKTGIEVPGESRGIFTEAENVTPLSLSNMSFGQGIAVTGVQMLAAYAAIANGGEYIRPTLIKKDLSAVAELEPENEHQLKKRTRVFSPKTSTDLTTALVGAVEKGTGTAAQIPHFQIAGKTATAQRVDKNGGYHGYVAGFIGFPVNVDRRFVIYVYIDNPKSGGYYGGAVAAPVFKNLAQYILYKNKDISKLADNDENAKDFDLKKIKTNIDIVQERSSSTRSFDPNSVPNLMGLDKVSTINIATKMNLQLIHKGMGVVKSQYPAAGTPISPELIIKLEYSPPKYE